MKKRPYDQYKKLKAWKILEQVFEDLVENNDIKETTDRYYIIGYILKNLNSKKKLNETPENSIDKIKKSSLS